MWLGKQVLAFFSQVEVGLRPFPSSHSKLLIGVSGGPDSLALLHVLKEVYPPNTLVVAHLNHGLRLSADAEAQFVSDTAVSWHIPCHTKKVDVIALAGDEGLSLEEAGRKARYRFFADLVAQIGAGAVAVAHNADDQAETVLMHLLRGSGLAGLRGMLPVSPLPGASNLTLLRPFLHISRDEIETYCQQHQLQPVQDSSNQDITFFRNRLRHQLLPLLKEYNPQIKRRLQHMATIVSADYAVLDRLVEQHWVEIVAQSDPNWISLHRAKWVALPPGLQRAILRKAVAELRPSLHNVTFQPIEQARQIAITEQTGVQSTLPGNLTLTLEYELLTITADPKAIPIHLPQLPTEQSIPLSVPGRVQLANQWLIEAAFVKSVDLPSIKNNQDPWQAFITTDSRPLQIRPRRPGERLQPLGMGGQSAKVKEVMANRKITAVLRPRWPLIANESHPVWLVGHHIDERVRVTANSQHIVQLKCYKQPPD